MTSRERILAALSHEPVDRVPIDFGGTRQSGISVFSYARLRKYLGCDPARLCRVFDVFQMLAEIEPVIAERLGSDCVALNRRAVAFGLPNENWRSFRLPTGLEVEVPGAFNPVEGEDGALTLMREGQAIAVMPAGGFYFDRLEKHPGALHVDLDAWSPPRLTPADLDHFHRESLRLYRETDRAIVAAMGPPYELFYGLGQGDFNAWMTTLASEPDYVRGLYRKLVDVWIENLEAFHGAVGDQVQVLQICDDFGTQRAPFLSVRMFRDLVLPAYKRGLDWVHQNTSWKVMLHSDGAIAPLLPSIIEMGVDILNPVQTTAAGMDPDYLKRTFGASLVFWGGSCDSQGTLAHGTPGQVAAETARNLEAFSRQSGFVCASIHNIQADVPPENIVALFDTALQHPTRP